MIFIVIARKQREACKMRYGLSVAYVSLLLISLVSSCLLFLIVASEAIKPTTDNHHNIKSSSSFEISSSDDNIAVGSAKQFPGQRKDNLKLSPAIAAADPRKNKIEEAAGVPPPPVSVSRVRSDDSVVRGSDGIALKRGSNDNAMGTGSVPKSLEDENGYGRDEGVMSADAEVASRDEAAAVAEPAVAAVTDAEKHVADETLPDIPANPAVITLGEKSPELVIDSHLDDEDGEFLDSVDSNYTDSEPTEKPFIQRDFVLLPEVKPIKKEVVLPHEVPPDETPPKIDDTGGTVGIADDIIPSLLDETTIDIPPTERTITKTSPEVNLTVEEHPIPVFSEWAQKQMEEAEKKLEKQVVNSSAMKKNTATGSKPQPMKLRAKNYASPDCGAKIIASNSDAQNTGALLTASRDEYMLSPCTNRIWFVVELCEAIQAEKIDLANFELFSSSPRNFSVAVNNRFPTREWSNVGRFIADDQRNIQSFELFPHLFGKFVRVDIHSHYNSEHFCPISLFRVYGTSEFEAFETENRLPVDDIDEFDDEETVELTGGNHLKNENNLFKSASDAVMSIVKKAAEVLVKTNSNKTDTASLNGTDPKLRSRHDCFTLRTAFSCDKCDESTANRINYLLSCRYKQLINFLSIEMLRTHLITSQICANRFNLDTTNLDNLACKQSSNAHVIVDERQSYVLSSLPIEYIAALCHILATDSNSKQNSSYNSSGGADAALNLTIDRKSGSSEFINISPVDDRRNKKLSKEKLPKLPITDRETEAVANANSKESNNKSETQGRRGDEVQNSVTLKDFNDMKTNDDDRRDVDDDQKESKVTKDDRDDVVLTTIPTSPSVQVPPVDGEDKEIKTTTAPSVNIFNLVEDVPETNLETFAPTTADHQSGSIETAETVGSELPSIKFDDAAKMQRDPAVDIEPTTWENLDHMLSEQVASESLNVGNADGMATVMHQTPQRVHSESVFLRLSNRIKALERNMSLSGQYLEELSRRYKKQVEELQHSFAKTLASIEEQNRRALEKEQILIAQNRNLKEELDYLSSRLNTWITFVICFGIFIMLYTLLLWMQTRRENKRSFRDSQENALVRRRRSNSVRVLFRRKSVEGVSGHPSPSHKVRRPSEEAMRITGSYKNLLIYDDSDPISIGNNDETKDTLTEISKKRLKQRHRKLSTFNGRRNGSMEQKSLLFERQESAPGDYVRSSISPTSICQDDDKLILDEDYESYIPGTDLAYNEFMPDGPSGNQIPSMNGKIPTTATTENGSQVIIGKKISSKARRLSSPSFLKSPFSRSNNASSKKSPHSPTGWEWYRLRKSEPKTINQNVSSQQIIDGKHLKKSKSESPELSSKINGFGNRGDNTPNSSMSEVILNKTGKGSDDSIRTSGTSTTTGSLLSNGNRTNSKKHGSFRRMFKKVF